MTQVNPRTLPIALVLGGVLIAVAAISGYMYAEVRDSFLTSIVVVGIIIGLTLALLGAILYFWERSHYWEHKRFSVNY